MCVQYIGGIVVQRGCSVHRGDIMSTSGDTMSTSGDTMSTSWGYHEYTGGVQYIGGYHECIGDVQYIRGYHEYIRGIS